ncbi:hypothetical protein LJC06_02555 [Bacteroidales bacterium OttesenSCG-928-I14]|nr:hypothetical protein [Bacteroidales bacterium OttesenSCG-928-I14]
MAAKRLPYSDEERIQVVRDIIDQEELAGKEDTILSVRVLHDMRNLLLTFEGTCFCFKQALSDETNAANKHNELFKSAQLYISHFIQVLNLAIIRNEIRVDSLGFYGLENSNQFTVPDLSTEDAVLEWGEKVINGELQRTRQGGAPIYNPAIAKVKVHYDLFKDSQYSLQIYRKNTIRNEGTLSEQREKINSLIWETWSLVEDKYWDLPQDERKQKFKDYHICFNYQHGVQLSVFG